MSDHTIASENDQKLKISIITINLNDKKGLTKTVDSVLDQTYDNIEYIIVDGGSTDGSAEYIKDRTDKFSYWVSEQDRGLYHAMNKGIDQATGEYLYFLNSRDFLASPNVIQNFVDLKPVEDIVYGDICIEVNGKWQRKIMPLKLDIGNTLNSTIVHQAIFHSKRLYNDGGRYDEKYKIVADWAFYNSAIVFRKCSYKHIDLVITMYDSNGISSDKELRVNERKKFFKDHFSDEFIELLQDYHRVSSRNDVLTGSRLVKLALRISSVLRKVKEVFR